MITPLSWINYFPPVSILQSTINIVKMIIYNISYRRYQNLRAASVLLLILGTKSFALAYKIYIILNMTYIIFTMLLGVAQTSHVIGRHSGGFLHHKRALQQWPPMPCNRIRTLWFWKYDELAGQILATDGVNILPQHKLSFMNSWYSFKRTCIMSFEAIKSPTA